MEHMREPEHIESSPQSWCRNLRRPCTPRDSFRAFQCLRLQLVCARGDHKCLGCHLEVEVHYINVSLQTQALKESF
ncbi:hypothetical protein K491DRAFT_783525 [Lophiostoma macrostomum CBS 122681]|uniref:Uncharacterized protein n=1 Tax=Lophiostoma macrostomum CBS 122681 TaxID=1314788 RepID=A0A6A6SNJ3_9PLEO|nr:hypothetical protein K491DRAFT_783525 [Lophiostoma macrostomum CBS 122681]